MNKSSINKVVLAHWTDDQREMSVQIHFTDESGFSIVNFRAGESKRELARMFRRLATGLEDDKYPEGGR